MRRLIGKLAAAALLWSGRWEKGTTIVFYIGGTQSGKREREEYARALLAKGQF